MNKPAAANEDYDIIMDMDELKQISSCGYLLELSPALQEKLRKHITSKLNTYAELGKEELGNYSHVVPLDELDVIGSILDQDSKLRVAFTGLFNRGKTFCINRLAQTMGYNNHLLSGKQHSTRGISFIKTGFTLLDTMGTNAPLLLEAIERAKKHIEKEFPVVEKHDSYANQAQYAEYKKMVFERETKLSDRAYEVAAINKKCIEAFLQNLIFSLANAVCVVVNELTFQDQIYISGIVQTMKAYLANQAKRKKPLDKFSKVIVLHNYHTCSDLVELEALKKKFVTDVYYGTSTTVDVSLDNGSVPIQIHESGNAETIHLFIGKDGSPAGANNKATFTYLKNILQVQAFPRSESLTSSMCGDIRNFLDNHFKSVPQVDMVTNEQQQLAFKILKSPELMYKSDKFEKSEYGGFDLQISKGNSYDPKYDIQKHPQYMLVAMDAPGICSTLLDRSKLNESFIKARINNQGDLIITGRRSLSFRPHKVATRIEFAIDQALVYACEDKSKITLPELCDDDWDLLERAHGSFVKKISIPHEYERTIYGMSIEDGVFLVLLKAKELESKEFSVV